MKKNIKGFTLIELLVVVATIALLAGVVLAALGNAKGNSGDVKVKSQMGQIRSAGEVYASNNSGNYGVGLSSACASGAFFGDAASGMLGLTTATNYPKNTVLDCGATITPNKYSVAASLASGWWCVDGTGVSRGKTVLGVSYTALTGSATAAHVVTGATSCN